MNIDIEKEIDDCYQYEIEVLCTDCLDIDEYRNEHSPPPSLKSNKDRSVQRKKVLSETSAICHSCGDYYEKENMLMCSNDNCNEYFCEKCLHKIAIKRNLDIFTILKKANEEKGYV